MAIDFSAFGISEELQRLLKQNGITEPTPIQEQAIPELLDGKDVIAQAQTGTGKTLAFLIPIVEKVNVNKSNIQALIITPTRELAIQITAEARKLAPLKGINILAAYGGQDVEQQIRKLKGSIHVVIGTPGRLLDHTRRQTVDFSRLSMLILDEADQMLDMGFQKDIEQIIHKTRAERQTMLFSATIPKGIRALSTRYMRNPYQIKIQSKNITLDEIKQVVIETTDRGKQDALCKAIDEYKPFMAMIFCRTKRRVSALNSALQMRGYNSEELHGDMSQAKRERVMKSFRKAEIVLLVATDVAARGLDIEGVTHVFNYDMPQDPENYIHRIGRTGRAGQTGIAITFVAPADREDLDTIEKAIKINIEKKKMPKHEENESNEYVTSLKAHVPGEYNRIKGSRSGGQKFDGKNRSGGRNSSANSNSSGRDRGGFKGRTGGTRTQGSETGGNRGKTNNFRGKGLTKQSRP